MCERLIYKEAQLTILTCSSALVAILRYPIQTGVPAHHVDTLDATTAQGRNCNLHREQFSFNAR
jgi:hypothetical protein